GRPAAARADRERWERPGPGRQPHVRGDERAGAVPEANLPYASLGRPRLVARPVVDVADHPAGYQEPERERRMRRVAQLVDPVLEVGLIRLLLEAPDPMHVRVFVGQPPG